MYPMNTGTSPWGYFDDMGIWRDWGAPANAPRATSSSPLANFHAQVTRVPKGAAGNPIVKTPPIATGTPDVDLAREMLSYGKPKQFISPGFGGIPEVKASAPKTSLNNSVFTGASKVPPKSTTVPNSTKAPKSKGKFLKEGGFFDPKSGKFGGVMDDIANPQFDYDAKTGLKGWGKNLGTLWNAGQMALQGYRAVQDLQNAGDYRDRSEDLMSDIVSASYNSPTVQYDLAPDQMETLRQLRDGDYETGTDLGDLDLLSILGDVGMGVLGGIPGGIGGMVLGGLGGLGTSLASNYSNAQSRQTAELEALYQAVLESEKQHNDLRKQRAYASYGLGGY